MRNLILTIASCSIGFSAQGADLPFRLATTSESNSLTGSTVIATSLSQTSFKTGATASAQRMTGSPTSDAKRADGAISKTYVQVLQEGASPGAQAVPPAVASTEYMEYEDNMNSAQAWATMSETGAPFVQVYADGKSKGQAAASWRTRYNVQGTGNRDVYVRFTIPGVRFGGRWSDSAPSLTRGKLRVDFLVNGYPAWFTEAVRWNTQNDSNGETVRIDTFGNSIGLEGNSAGTSQAILTTTSRVITLKLGTYPANKPLDFTMLYQVEGRGASECQVEGSDKYCGNISMRVDWTPNAPQPTFFSKPAP